MPVCDGKEQFQLLADATPTTTGMGYHSGAGSRGGAALNPDHADGSTAAHPGYSRLLPPPEDSAAFWSTSMYSLIASTENAAPGTFSISF
jgi:hypothetical protein